ncbi:hypothetical protein F2P45_10965 [Massilia sp. CCM 8733]|uniref:CopG family transcriptional regulator n=1 Tax=Massilia mucilaginosa TaxID=2609282 RepID=A0ABX0NRX2_9BURK|nr:hypothetical protein [Massilia mucilaginosa]NHZ89531.1 hypothetical protein [Massilia mucilaginosa]
MTLFTEFLLMPSTSLELSAQLKERVVAAAERLGISTHAFMVGAIRQATDAAEQRAEFVAQAQAALADMRETGLGYDAEDVRAYLRERLMHDKAVRPEPKYWRTWRVSVPSPEGREYPA